MGVSGALGPDSPLLIFWLLAREVFFFTIKQTLHSVNDVNNGEERQEEAGWV